MYLFNLTLHFDRKFTASDGQAGDLFGNAVASCGKVVVGAQGGSKSGAKMGAVYVFDLDTKKEVRKLTPSDGMAGDLFGFGVAISGNIIIVSAPAHGSGAVYIFDASSGEQLQTFTNTDPIEADKVFGRQPALDLDANMNVGIVGNPVNKNGSIANVGAVYIFDLTTGNEIRKITPAVPISNLFFGFSLFVSADFLMVGAPSGSGRVYVFDINDNWKELTFFLAPNNEATTGLGENMATSGQQFIIDAFDGGPLDGVRNGAVYLGNLTKGTGLLSLS